MPKPINPLIYVLRKSNLSDGRKATFKSDKGRVDVTVTEETVRFRIYPGATCEISEGGPTDEGYDWEHITVTWENGRFLINQDWDSRDCDGRMSGNGTYQSYGGRKWEEMDSRHRDFTAEAMGY